jgi:hypothetical protein
MMKALLSVVLILALTCCNDDKQDDVSKRQKEIIETQDEIILVKKQYVEAEEKLIEAEKELIETQERMKVQTADAQKKLLETEATVRSAKSIISRQNSEITKLKELNLELHETIKKSEDAKKEELVKDYEWKSKKISSGWHNSLEISFALNLGTRKIIIKRKQVDKEVSGGKPKTEVSRIRISFFSFYDEDGFLVSTLSVGDYLHDIEVKREFTEEDGTIVTLGIIGEKVTWDILKKIHKDSTKVEFEHKF